MNCKQCGLNLDDHTLHELQVCKLKHELKVGD